MLSKTCRGHDLLLAHSCTEFNQIYVNCFYAFDIFFPFYILVVLSKLDIKLVTSVYLCDYFVYN